MRQELEAAHSELVSRLVKEVVEHNPDNMRTNLKAALPLLGQIIRDEGLNKIFAA
eukprot:CAMPEP_0184547966 /NCGR_PEP_ID=MMETSP0199_2-20130426/5915_1 /TAXON_ID=1112570 /ORGANISM="Thraustochytrium sp., Strain LLF1b" /LENGTH=54 /DNA_ID=CAMNT_0026942525 /DNA_START=1 /DNA_END=162 /DNA_ORIENTATION=+